MEAVEDPVGGNNRALALKIAAEHPGMHPGGEGGGPFLLLVLTMRMLATTS